jgi:hypothetical protein
MSRKNKISIYDRNASNDIRYRGPLSYRHLQIMGWFGISFLVLHTLIELGIMIDPNQPKWVLSLNAVASVVSEFALPLFLFANFAILLDRKKTFKAQLLKFGGLSLLVVILFLLVTEHYILEVGTAIAGDKAGVQAQIDGYFLSRIRTGSLSFNLFVDMFLCTLLLFFLEYTPRKVFTGKKRYLFRMFALIPVVYEAGSLVIRILAYYGMISPPLIVYPLLTTKPPMSFVLFVILVLFIKIREFRFRKRGKTKQEYMEFTKTRLNSLQFSVFSSIMILVTGVIDLILLIGFSAFDIVVKNMDHPEQVKNASEQALEEMSMVSARGVTGWGIGLHSTMIFIIPIILLFSYTRNHKNPKADIAIPIGGILLAVFVGIEGLHQGILMNIPIIMNMIQESLNTYLVGGGLP